MKRTETFYDPLGFLSPYVIRSKLPIPKAWLGARDWDELLPSHHQREWTKWFRELDDLELVKTPRCLNDLSPKVEELSVHTFSDASENPYPAVVYAHHVYDGWSITAQLIMSKSRLASLKAVSIPRLELLGALIRLRFTRQVCSAMKTPTNGVTYLVDIMNVGYWIQGQSREYYKSRSQPIVGQSREYKPFIAEPIVLGKFTSSLLLINALCSLLLWNKRPDSERISTDRLTVEWPRISEEVKTRLARVQV